MTPRTGDPGSDARHTGIQTPDRGTSARPLPVMRVGFDGGECYTGQVRGHTVRADQPVSDGGWDTAPSPVELFVFSLAACAGFYAGRYLDRRGVPRDGLAVEASYQMATDPPARVAAVQLRVAVPAGLAEANWPALRAVVAHCTVHNSLIMPPEVGIELAHC